MVGARVSYRLLPRDCSCSARSTDRKAQEWTHGRGRPGGSAALLPAGSGAGLQPRRLHRIIPCFSVSIVTASPTPRVVSAGGRVTKVTLAPPTGPRPIGAPLSVRAELQR